MVRQQTKRRSGGLIRRGGDRRLQLGALGRRGVRVLGLSRLAVQALRASGGDNLESARDVLKRMMGSGYGFDPASFMQVIDGLPRMGNKREFDELADHMIEMVSTVEPLVSTQGSTAGENSGTYATSVTIMMIVTVPTAAANTKTYPNRRLLRITRRHSIIGQQ
nr:pentatricopeptide repeat-containing protein At2g17140 [Ipomoea batatas]GME18880.1 pentatricopeptide repeat-containing protein At2g17140 [Ipomoea batatas]